jgi:hypothetical protein
VKPSGGERKSDTLYGEQGVSETTTVAISRDKEGQQHRQTTNWCEKRGRKGVGRRANRRRVRRHR